MMMMMDIRMADKYKITKRKLGWSDEYVSTVGLGTMVKERKQRLQNFQWCKNEWRFYENSKKKKKLPVGY